MGSDIRDTRNGAGTKDSWAECVDVSCTWSTAWWHGNRRGGPARTGSEKMVAEQQPVLPVTGVAEDETTLMRASPFPIGSVNADASATEHSMTALRGAPRSSKKGPKQLWQSWMWQLDRVGEPTVLDDCVSEDDELDDGTLQADTTANHIFQQLER